MIHDHVTTKLAAGQPPDVLRQAVFSRVRDWSLVQGDNMAHNDAFIVESSAAGPSPGAPGVGAASPREMPSLSERPSPRPKWEHHLRTFAPQRRYVCRPDPTHFNVAEMLDAD